MEVDVGGTRVSYVRQGAGEAVLLLHGGMSSHREWRHQVAALSGSYDVVAWDAPGGGGSGDPGEDWRLADFADCVLGLADALGITQAHVVGLSFGGGLALEVFRRRPSFVRSLALLSAYAGWRGSLPEDEVAARLAACLAVADDPQAMTPEQARVFVGDDPSPSLLAEVAGLEEGTRASTYRVAARAFAEADLRPVLPTVDVPTLVLHGGADRRCPPSVGRALADGIPGARLEVLEGVGHCMNVEAPDRVTAALLAHLSR